ncbi:MAG: glycosyltransferase [Candidatus Sumerlaeaceae bacterium]
MSRLRILYLVNAFEHDSPTLLCREIARGSVNRGHEVVMMAWSRTGPLEVELQRDGIAPTSVDKSLVRLRKTLKGFKPHLVHTILARPTIVGAPVAKLAGVPVVVAGHHGVHEWEEKGRVASFVAPRLFRLSARYVDCFAAVSGSAADELRDNGISSQKVQVLPNGIDTEQFSSCEETSGLDVRRELFPDDDVFAIQVIGSLGNLRPVKGYMELLRAAAAISKSCPSARFVIWGEGPLREDLEAAIGLMSLTPVFKLPGKTNDAAGCLRACDVYVQPSQRESFGMAIGEAMACGLPVVVANAGGLPELVADSGIVYTEGSAGLEKAIIDLLKDAGERRRLGAAARLRIAEQFSRRRMVESYMALYDQLAAKAGL